MTLRASRVLVLGIVLVACEKPDANPPPSPTEVRPPGLAARKPQLAIGTGAYGSAHPTVFRSYDRFGKRWMVLCQARRDTDGDGKIEIHVGHHGGVFGDAIEPFLVIGGGLGTPIDALVGRSKDDRWLAILRGDRLELLDVSTGELWDLAGADVASDERPGVPHRAAMFADDHLLFVRHRAAGDALVAHALANHAERELAVKDRLWRIARADRVAKIYTIPRGEPFPRLQTTLDAGECLGDWLSHSTHGQSGPDPTERWIDLERGTEIAAPAKPADVEQPPPVATPVLAADPMGPARWP